MNKGLIIEMPIHSHIKKMIAMHKTIEPFKISIGKCVYSEIIFYNFTRQNIKLSYRKERSFNDSLKIQISNEQMRENRFRYDNKRIHKIDQLLRGMFEEKLVNFLDYNIEKKGTHSNGNIKDNILNFMDFYNLDDNDISFGGLQKMYFRHREKIKKK